MQSIRAEHTLLNRLALYFTLTISGIPAAGLLIILSNLFASFHGEFSRYAVFFLALFFLSWASLAGIAGKRPSSKLSIAITDFTFILFTVCIGLLPSIIMRIPLSWSPHVFFTLHMILGLLTGLKTFNLRILCEVIKPGMPCDTTMISCITLGGSLTAAFFIYSVPILGLHMSTVIILVCNVLAFFLSMTVWRPRIISSDR